MDCETSWSFLLTSTLGTLSRPAPAGGGQHACIEPPGPGVSFQVGVHVRQG
jgi:hypothetical protein